MQLHLDTAELDLIADVLLQSEAQVSSPQASEASPNGQKAPDSGIYEELLDNVLARNMEFHDLAASVVHVSGVRCNRRLVIANRTARFVRFRWGTEAVAI